MLGLPDRGLRGLRDLGTHFIAMLGHRVPVSVSFDPEPPLLSIVGLHFSGMAAFQVTQIGGLADDGSKGRSRSRSSWSASSSWEPACRAT